jgi:hypothetical protein
MNDNVKNLRDRFKFLIHDVINKAINVAMEEEEAMNIAAELANSGVAELTIEYKIPFSFIHTDEDGETIEDNESETKNETKNEPKVNFKFGGAEDMKFLSDMGLSSSEEIADMEKAIQEVRGVPADKPQVLQKEPEQKVSPEAEVSQEDLPMEDMRIVLTIAELSKRMTDTFKRHLVAYSFNKTPDFRGLKNGEGERVQFPTGEKIGPYLFDDKIWLTKMVEITRAILAAEPTVRKELLVRFEYMLAQYLKFDEA